jgi:hypothetical protein
MGLADHVCVYETQFNTPINNCMITLTKRGGGGIHTLAALLDYCTVQGGLDGYPNMTPGDNLHSHGQTYQRSKNKFYNADGLLHKHSDEKTFFKLFGKYLFVPRTVNYKKIKGLTLGNIAKDDFGRLLIFAMAFGKTFDKKLPPDDHQINYSNCNNLSEKIELVSLIVADVLKQNFETFFGHNFPTYHIDILWYWNNPDKICTIIEQCGWNPIVDKVHKFCQRVTVFNEPYYSTVERSVHAYHQVLNQQDVPCSLTFYETAMTHALLINHYGCTHPSQIKLIHELPTSTGEFFNLYNPVQSQ